MIALAALAASAGCGGGTARDLATGADDDVALVLGEGIPESARTLLERSLAEEVRFAHPQALFRTERVPIGEIDRAKSKKNVVLLALLTVPGKGALLAREILSEEQISNASSHHGAIAAFDDLWRREQSVVVIAASDAEGILSLVEERSQRIQDVVLSTAKARVAERLYRGGEDVEAARRLSAEAGWSVRVPARDWKLDLPGVAGGITRIAARDPDRALSVYWVPADSATLDAEGAVALCDGFGSRFAEGAAVARDRSTVTETSHQGYRALCISGAWTRADGTSSGALRSVAFLEPRQRRVYLLDARAATGAADEKMAIWQLEALANTFRVAPAP